MSKANSADDKRGASDDSGESELRGEALDGAERKRAVDHTKHEKTRNPDAALHVDGEEDTLYDDGLELEDDSAILANTPRNNNMR
jgi:hypothetical protein